MKGSGSKEIYEMDPIKDINAKCLISEELDRNEYSPVEGWGENGRGVSLNITQEVQAIKTFAINQVNFQNSFLLL